MEVTFHRFVLAEFNTHRIMSRNSASSRAIPVEKTLRRVTENPAWPLKWPAEQPGMQGGSELVGGDLADARRLLEAIWNDTLNRISAYVSSHPDKSTRLHKSILNRPMEWFSWHTVIASSTSFAGFFEQRVSPLAQPEIEAPAALMLQAYNSSTPVLLKPGEWHRPYMEADDPEWARSHAKHDAVTTADDLLNQMSVARCARVSTLNHDGVRDPNKDVGLFAKLVSANPIHYSPLEHVATPLAEGESAPGNFEGWAQLRHKVEARAA